MKFSSRHFLHSESREIIYEFKKVMEKERSKRREQEMRLSSQENVQPSHLPLEFAWQMSTNLARKRERMRISVSSPSSVVWFLPANSNSSREVREKTRIISAEQGNRAVVCMLPDKSMLVLQ